MILVLILKAPQYEYTVGSSTQYSTMLSNYLPIYTYTYYRAININKVYRSTATGTGVPALDFGYQVSIKSTTCYLNVLDSRCSVLSVDKFFEYDSILQLWNLYL